MVVVNYDFTHQVILKNGWNPLSLCVLCDLCGLNCGFWMYLWHTELI